LWQGSVLENRLVAAHIYWMASSIWTTEHFTCPNCGLDYAATKEQHSERRSGSFSCQVCKAEVHAWSGVYDFFDWRAANVSSAPAFGKKK
jgi:predicted SprT family Zn-dependent metalloprotease